MKGTDKNLLCSGCDFTCMRVVYTSDDFELININKNCIDFKKGDTIIKQGSFASEVLYLKTGLVKVIIEGKKNKNTILKIIPGCNFIVLPVLDEYLNQPATIEAITNCEVCQIRKNCITEIMKRNSKANSYISQWLTNDYFYLYNRISVLSTRNNHGKLASALILLSNGEFKNIDVFQYLSRKDLAELASISLESVNKILLELKNDRIIDIDNKIIKILKPDLIETLSYIG